ncbi:MAG: hypothetical protein HRU19_24450 [Pseudobacteriovorax sp.]|nr:hypothetical protein [Pseudobacteriovorax sp.]
MKTALLMASALIAPSMFAAPKYIKIDLNTDLEGFDPSLYQDVQDLLEDESEMIAAWDAYRWNLKQNARFCITTSPKYLVPLYEKIAALIVNPSNNSIGFTHVCSGPLMPPRPTCPIPRPTLETLNKVQGRIVDSFPQSSTFAIHVSLPSLHVDQNTCAITYQADYSVNGHIAPLPEYGPGQSVCLYAGVATVQNMSGNGSISFKEDRSKCKT